MEYGVVFFLETTYGVRGDVFLETTYGVRGDV